MTQMTESEARERILPLIHRIAPEADLDALQGDVTLREQIDFDSMDALNLFAGLAETFSIEVSETDYGRIQTLDAMVTYVVERRGGASARG